MAQYLSVYPVAQKSSYVPLDVVEFQLDVPVGQSLLLNSITFSGVLNPPTNEESLFMDGVAGIHAFFNNINTVLISQAGYQTVESLSSYPRYVKMARTATMTKNDYCNTSSLRTELVDIVENSQVYLTGIPQAFSFKPQICLNKASTLDGTPAFLSSGVVKIQFRLVSSVECFFGAEMNAQSFSISDLRCDYTSAPVQKKSPVICEVIQELRQIIQSKQAAITSSLPMSSYSVSGSCQLSADEYNTLTNNLSLDYITGLSAIQYGFNSSSSNYIFTLDNLTSILEYGINSIAPLNGVRKHDISVEDVEQDKKLLVGLSYSDSPLESLGQLMMTISSNADYINKVNLYLFFKTTGAL